MHFILSSVKAFALINATKANVKLKIKETMRLRARTSRCATILRDSKSSCNTIYTVRAPDSIFYSQRGRSLKRKGGGGGVARKRIGAHEAEGAPRVFLAPKTPCPFQTPAT